VSDLMATAEQVRVLDRFNEKVEKLERLRFLHDPAQVGAIVEWRKGVGWDGVTWDPRTSPSTRLSLSLRFFLQDNEPTSLRNMTVLYPTLGVGAALVAEFLQLRQDLNEYLDSPSNWLFLITGK